MIVPGTANPWLAGMPNGSVGGNGYDTAPNQSPVLASGTPLQPGDRLTFTAAGEIDHIGGAGGPDGLASQVYSRMPGAENGISDINCPIDALLGVFLDDSQPSLQLAPGGLDYSAAASRDFLTFSPVLRQVFYIGDGFNSNNKQQEFVVPAGATRLFLGVMDGEQWSNNTGSFTVNMVAVPEPSTLGVCGLAGLLTLKRRSRRS